MFWCIWQGIEENTQNQEIASREQTEIKGNKDIIDNRDSGP